MVLGKSMLACLLVVETRNMRDDENCNVFLSKKGHHTGIFIKVMPMAYENCNLGIMKIRKEWYVEGHFVHRTWITATLTHVYVGLHSSWWQ